MESPNCNRLYLSSSGSLIVAYGPIAHRNSGESELTEHEIQVFDKRGTRVTHITGRGDWEIQRLVIDTTDSLLYYDAGKVTAFDLAAGHILTEVPTEPLVATAHSDDPVSARMAAALLDWISGGWDATHGK